MENTIISIQKFAKSLRIIARIVFVACIVGLCLCVTAMVWLAAGGDLLRIGGEVIIHGPMAVTDGQSIADVWGELSYTTAVLAFSIAIARLCVSLFGAMQSGSTPFTMENARCIRKIAVVMIVAAVVPPIVGSGVGMTVSELCGEAFSASFEAGFSLLTVLVFFAISIVFKYGCQLQEQVDETL